MDTQVLAAYIMGGSAIVVALIGLVASRPSKAPNNARRGKAVWYALALLGVVLAGSAFAFILGRYEMVADQYSLVERIAAPIGSIVAWHKHPGAHERADPSKAEPISDKPPEGWQECDGTPLPKDSPLRRWGATTTPDLNGRRLFLRGDSSTSGKQEGDATKKHSHPFAAENPPGGSGFLVKTGPGKQGIPDGTGPEHYEVRPETGAVGGSETETRPKNMSVVWIIRVK